MSPPGIVIPAVGVLNGVLMFALLPTVVGHSDRDPGERTPGRGVVGLAVVAAGGPMKAA